MKSRVFTFALCAAAAFALAACGGGKTSTAHQGKEIGIELPLLTSPFWQSYDSYLPRFAAQYGLRVLPASNANADTSKFLTDVQNMIDEGVDGLVISPTDTAAVVTSLDKAQAAHVPVVAVDVAPDGGKVFMVVRADNKEYGRLACRYIGDHVAAGEVVQIQGDLASINGRDRTEAFNDCMEKKYPNIKVLQIDARWDGERAASGLEALYAAHPRIKGIYMQAGGVYLAPTLAVLRRHGALVPPGDPHHITIVSNDGIPQELDAIRKGEIDATVSQPADLYAQYGLYYIKAALQHESFRPGPTTHGSVIVRLPSGILEDELPAPLITKANVDDKRFWGNTLQPQS
jgi:ribose transport system substrate-binding protein